MLRNVRHIVSSLAESNATRINSLNRRILNLNRIALFQFRAKKTNPSSISSLFKPIDVKPSQDDSNVGAEITGKTIDKNDIARILNRFVQLGEVRMLCVENGLDGENDFIILELH
jgi:Suv3 helical N-terminal domain